MRIGSYYLLATLEHLRANNTLFASPEESANGIRIMPDERPFPGCGPLFIGLRIGNQRMDKKVLPSRSEVCEIVISITLRTTTSPLPELGANFYVRDDGSINFQASIEHVASHIVDLIDNNNDLMLEVQHQICRAEGETAAPATGILRWKNALPQIRIVDNSHFIEHSEHTNTRNDCGLLEILTFGDGERLT